MSFKPEEMAFTLEEFILFCKMYEKRNEYEFDESNLIKTDTGYKYEATFRDEFNYHHTVEIYLDGDIINWNEPEFNEDEEEDTKPFFNSLIEEVFGDFKRAIKKK